MKVLIISPIELFYEPRLRKAAISFENNGFDVHILVCLRMQNLTAEYEFLKEQNPNWTWHEIDLRKNTIKSRLRWLSSKLAHRFFFNVYKYTSIDLSREKGILNDAFYMGKKLNLDFDIVYTNLIDMLPLANHYSLKSAKCKLIYDSQEFFTGQYSVMNKTRYKWVCNTEQRLITKCYLVIATTNAMKDELIKKYSTINKIVRCRNVPLLNEIPKEHKHELSDPISIIWHGKSINIYSARGVYLIVQAVLEIDKDVRLFLQGSIKDEEREKLSKLIKNSGSKNIVKVLPPARADKIVESIKEYDIGFIGETPTELNQVLTSSNKLFDYITAGLAILSPSIPGILETTEYYKNAKTYEQASLNDLKRCLSELIENKETLLSIKSKSREASKLCVWEDDFLVVTDTILS